MNFIKHNNGNINIIFLHGWGADYTSFYFLKDLLKTFALHFANLDGFGGTCPPQDPTIQGYSDRLHNYISQNNLNNVILVGHSFGGRVALQYASQHKLLGLVLVDSAGIKPRFSLTKQLKVLKYKFTKYCVKIGLKNQKCLNKYGSQDYKNASNPMKQVLLSCTHYNQKSLLYKISVKTLIIWGENDKDTPIYMAKTLHRGIKSSKLVVLNNSGHFSFLDNQYAFYKCLKDYLNNIKGECYE